MINKIIEHLQSIKQPLVLVAIDGHSAAGKSTLAHKLQQAMRDVTIIHTDDFYRVLNPNERAKLTAEEGYNLFYDWQRLKEEVLLPLSQGQISRFQKYDWEHNQLGDWVKDVEPSGIVIVEGCYSFRPQLRHYYAATIFVETASEIRNQRQRQRADDWSWIERWHAAEQFYVEHYRPREFANFIVTGDQT